MQTMYSTQDFYLASYLFVLGNQINETRLANRNTTEFEFTDNKKLQQAIDKFYAMKATVDPLTYGSALRSIKSMIHALKDAHTPSNSRGLNNEFNNKHREQISRG